jgi:transporter family protein
MHWAWFAIGSAFFAALTTLLGKFGVASISSNLATLIRTVVIVFLTIAIVSFRHEWQKPSTFSLTSCLFLIASGLTTGLSWLCYYRALQLGPITKVAPIDKLSVAVAIVFGVLFLGEKLTLPILIGSLLIVGGSIVILIF